MSHMKQTTKKKKKPLKILSCPMEMPEIMCIGLHQANAATIYNLIICPSRYISPTRLFNKTTVIQTNMRTRHIHRYNRTSVQKKGTHYKTITLRPRQNTICHIPQ